MTEPNESLGSPIDRLIQRQREREDAWARMADTLGHELALNEQGRPDFFALEHGFHNGPRCVRCDHDWCHHCNPDGPKERCPG